MQKPIRILQHMRVLDSGGIEAFVFANLKAIDRNEVVFDFLVTRDQEEFYDKEVERLGGRKIVLHYKRYNNRLLNPLSQSIAFYRFCKANREIYQTVHFQSIGSNGIFDIVAATLAGIKWRIAHSHIADDIKPANQNSQETVSFYRKNLILIRQFLVRHLVSIFSTHYFGCSQRACQWMFTKKRIKEGQTIVVKNPIDVEKFIFNSFDREYFRKKLGIENNLVIGHVGRFVFSKNHVFLLKVFKQITVQNPETKLILVGNGPLKEEVEAQIKELELENNVILYGETSEVYRLYNAFDMFVFPSIYEGLGIVLVEAQANGLPVVASDSIPHEVKLTDNFEFCSLESGVEAWAENIMRRAGERRNVNNPEFVYKAGYDIKDVSVFLENIYMELGGR